MCFAGVSCEREESGEANAVHGGEGIVSWPSYYQEMQGGGISLSPERG